MPSLHAVLSFVCHASMVTMRFRSLRWYVFCVMDSAGAATSCPLALRYITFLEPLDSDVFLADLSSSPSLSLRYTQSHSFESQLQQLFHEDQHEILLHPRGPWPDGLCYGLATR